MHGLSRPSFASSRQIQHASSSGVSRTGTRVRAISQRRARIRGRSVNAFTEKDASVVDAEGAEGGLGRPGVSRGPEPSRRARRDAATTYLRGPRPAPPTWCVGDPCRTPSPRTGWRGKVRVRTAFAPTRDATRVDARVPGRRACVERVAVSVTRAFESMRAIRAKRVKDVARFAKDARACGYARTTAGSTVTRHFMYARNI